MKTVYHKVTGEAFTREPVDASEMLASGQYQSEQLVIEEPVIEAVDDSADDAVVNPFADKKASKKK